MNQLLLDTACSRGLVAIAQDNQIVASYYLEETLKHAEKLADAIESCLTMAAIKTTELDRIVVGKGPGSFVGVRIAMAHAKGMAFALGIPVVGVCTLRAIAGGKSETVYIDARRGEFYVLDQGSDPRTVKHDMLQETWITAPGLTPEGMLFVCPTETIDEIMTLTPAYVREPDAKRIDEQ